MNHHILLIIAGVTPALGLLCFYDWKFRRLPNVLTLGMLALALVIRWIGGGNFSLLSGIAGAMIGGVFLLVPFMLKGAGGGDVKMMAAAGGIAGASEACTLLLATSILGLLLGGAMLIFKQVNAKRCVHLLRSLFDWRYDRKKGRENLPPRNDEKGRIPFGIAIAAGLEFTLILEYFMS